MGVIRQPRKGVARTHGRRSRLLVAAVVIGVAPLAGAVPALGSPSASSGGNAGVAYNSIPSKVSGNVPSVGFEATQTYEFGDEVSLGGTARTLKSMSVVLSSWACQTGHWYNATTDTCQSAAGSTFSVPMTFTIYSDTTGAPGGIVAQTQETVSVAYRPSASAQCTGDDAGKWYNSKDRTCYNGFPQTVTATFPAITLPDSVIWSVAFNTTSNGVNALGTQVCSTADGGCPYDSLNVGAESFPNAPYSGIDINEDQAFVNGGMQSGFTGFRPLGMIVAA